MSSIKIVDLELSQPIEPLTGLDDYSDVWILLRLHGFPVGEAQVPVISNRIEPERLIDAAIAWAGWSILLHLLEDNVLNSASDSTSGLVDSLAATLTSVQTLQQQADPLQSLKENLRSGLKNSGDRPACQKYRLSKAKWFVTVAVCTRDNAEQLKECLDALEKLEYPDYEVIVVDNAPQSKAVSKLLDQRNSARIRYIVEPRLGSSWGRNRALQEARGDIIVFTEDNARPDPLWLLSLVTTLQNPGISMVLGLTYPFEKANQAQLESLSKFERSFERKVYSLKAPEFPTPPYQIFELGGRYNLAGWRGNFEDLQGFDVALGTDYIPASVTTADLLYRLITKGYNLAYDPTALVKVAYSSDYNEMRRQKQFESTGIFAFLTKCYINEPENRNKVLWYALKALWQEWFWPSRSKPLSKMNRNRVLSIKHLKATLIGPQYYRKALKKARELTAQYNQNGARS
ncbi:MAG TPA: glycosyltransferase [Chloroflexia bacterium]|nr:glycosyltransferase [Chloroflexia bacterium]